MASNGFSLQFAKHLENARTNWNVIQQQRIQTQCQIDSANDQLQVLKEGHDVNNRFDEMYPNFELDNADLNVQMIDAQNDLFLAQCAQSVKAMTEQHLQTNLSQEMIGEELLTECFYDCPVNLMHVLDQKLHVTSKMLDRGKAFNAVTNEWQLSDDFHVRMRFLLVRYCLGLKMYIFLY